MEKLLSTADVPPQFLKAVYMVGHVPPKALASDPRVSYSLYIPPEKYTVDAENSSHGSEPSKLPLLVYVHGTRRDTSALYNELAALAEATPCAVVAPLFPAGLDGPNDLDSYKLLRSATLRSDLALLSVLDEVSRRWPGIRADKVALLGYSGGAQFALRFLYLYPGRLAAASLGAPGLVTLPDDARAWPAGTADAGRLFGREVDKGAVRAVDIQLAVGGADVATPGGGRDFWDWLGEMRARRGDAGEAAGARSGKADAKGLGVRQSRLEALRQLRDAWERAGIEAQFDVVEGVAHDEAGVRETMLGFLKSRMQRGL